MSAPTVGVGVDWRFAATVGARLTRPAPPVSAYTRDQAKDQLADCARRAELPVREVSGLGEDGPVPEARIVDRPQWVTAAAKSMCQLTGGRADGRARSLVTGRLAGAQTGAVLAFVSSGILGQFDPFDPDGGRLLLVYPNVIVVERQLRVVPADFRLWVCLHEVTHRVQFAANPWLAGHMQDALAVLTDDTGERPEQVLSRLAEHVRARRSGDPDPGASGVVGVMRAVQSEPARAALDRLLVLGTLLEGHADHVMDAVGPKVVPTVNVIRARFDQRRRQRQPPLQRLLRALLGVDAKLDQYTRGKKFVDGVVGRVGVARFNAIWTGPDTLPQPPEIDDPQRWIDRVL